MSTSGVPSTDPRRPLDLVWALTGEDDPYPVYEQIRAYGPLAGQDGEYVTVEHAVVNTVLRSRDFGLRPHGDPGPVADDPSGATLDLGFLERNPPDHTRLRRLAAPAFRPAMMAHYGDRIRALTRELVAGIDVTEPFDLVAAFAAPLPIGVITTLMGIPDADVPRLSRHGALIGSALSGVESPEHARALAAANADLYALFDELLPRKKAEPADDVLSYLVAASPDGITTYELYTAARLLLAAGFETTVNLVGNGVAAMLDTRDQWQLLCDRPELAASAVEEVLRFDAPVQNTSRIAGRDTTVAGVELPAGSWVLLLLAAANRDPAVFADPDVFDIARTPAAEHLAFSSGIHYCLGAPLARLEGRIAFEELSRSWPRLRRAGVGERRESRVIRGYARLPVVAE